MSYLVLYSRQRKATFDRVSTPSQSAWKSWKVLEKNFDLEKCLNSGVFSKKSWKVLEKKIWQFRSGFQYPFCGLFCCCVFCGLNTLNLIKIFFHLRWILCDILFSWWRLIVGRAYWSGSIGYLIKIKEVYYTSLI